MSSCRLACAWIPSKLKHALKRQILPQNPFISKTHFQEMWQGRHGYTASRSDLGVFVSPSWALHLLACTLCKFHDPERNVQSDCRQLMPILIQPSLQGRPLLLTAITLPRYQGCLNGRSISAFISLCNVNW